MSRYLIPASITATTIAVTLGLEMVSPGFTIIALFVIAKVATGLLLAAMWPITAAALLWIGWKFGQMAGYRDAVQEAAAKAAARESRLAGSRDLYRIGEN